MAYIRYHDTSIPVYEIHRVFHIVCVKNGEDRVRTATKSFPFYFAKHLKHYLYIFCVSV